VIGAANIFAPRSSRTAMKFPGLAKLGRSVPMRCATKDAWLLASFFDEHSCPIKSWARMSPTKSKKNRFMIAQQKWDCSVPEKIGLAARETESRSRASANIGALTVACLSMTSTSAKRSSGPLPRPILIEARLTSLQKPSFCSTARAKLESRNRFLTPKRHATSIAAVSCASGNLRTCE
jgi:hypothetical protein